MFISRLLALGIAGFGVYIALIDLTSINSEPKISLPILIVALVLLSIMLLSFSKKHFKGIYKVDNEKPESLKHENILGLYPLMKVVQFSGDNYIRESLLKAINSNKEHVILKTFVRESGHRVRCLLIITNKRTIIYRTQSFGIVLFFRSITGLIEKIPFGFLFTLPFEGFGDGFKRVFNSEWKSLKKVMKIPDSKLLNGKVDKWKIIQTLNHSNLFDKASVVSISTHTFSEGFSYNLVTKKLKNIFKFKAFEYPYHEHFNVIRCICFIVSNHLNNIGISTTIEKNEIIFKPIDTT